MSKLSEKEIHILSGELAAACSIINEVCQSLFYAEKTPTTRTAILDARAAADKARKALRAISYEIESAEQDPEKQAEKYYAVGVDYGDNWEEQRTNPGFEYCDLARDRPYPTGFTDDYCIYGSLKNAKAREDRILDHGTKIYHMTLAEIEEFFGVSL